MAVGSVLWESGRWTMLELLAPWLICDDDAANDVQRDEEHIEVDDGIVDGCIVALGGCAALELRGSRGISALYCSFDIQSSKKGLAGIGELGNRVL